MIIFLGERTVPESAKKSSRATALGPDGWRDQCHHIGCPTRAKYLTDEATLDPTSVTKLLEKDKHDKHGAAAARIDVDFTAIALTTYAGIGDEILNKHVNPYFNDLREKELKEGGNGWKTSQRRLRFLEKNSIVMCRGNADMIRRATPYQKAVAIRRAG